MSEPLPEPDAKQAVRPPIDMGPLPSRIGFLLRLAQLRVFALVFSQLKNRDLRPGELSILIVIERNPGIRQGVLAEALSIKRAHMTKIVQSMEAAGLVTRRIPPDDRRAIELSLSEKGRTRALVDSRALLDIEETAGSSLTSAEAAELARLLRKFLDLPAR